MTGVLLPQTMTFAAFISLLKQDFPGVIMPNNINESEWKEIASQIVTDPSFAKFVGPAPDGYAEPNSWMQAFANAIY